ncbi:hypothetical protein D3OALGA1CA_142 [Olavius algarvensis associated proteobacterium Delta 3]|nr:hypothetical protein D3OALGA1CA_142 [Olavius algarvensis associated proteobacterium Delta 3]
MDPIHTRSQFDYKAGKGLDVPGIRSRYSSPPVDPVSLFG